MNDIDEKILEFKKKLYIIGAKELLEKELIHVIIDKDSEFYILKLENRILFRAQVSDLAPIRRTDLFNRVDNFVTKILRVRGYEFKLSSEGRESLRCLIRQEIMLINTARDDFPKLIKMFSKLSKVEVFD